LPLFLVFFGYGETARLVLVGLSATFPMVIAARTAVHGIDPLLIDVCQSYRITGFLRLRRLVLPACRPVVLAGLRLAINTALIVAISVEMLAANNGLGAILWFGWQTMRLYIKGLSSELCD
jgi:ABC-type nitrate/sulfonate/bicarbonate transport system permease component